jgi:hypothetical protein
LDLAVNLVNNSAHKEYFESGGEIGPDVAPNLDVDIKSIDIGLNINTFNCWNLATVGESLLVK